MKITLISASAGFSYDGPRLISSILKNAGHQVQCVFLSRYMPLEYTLEEIEQLDELIRRCDLVMVAVYTSFVQRAIMITDYVHKRYPDMKVIWGGPHCVSAPELSLRHADGVCIAEGDEAVVELVNKMESGQDYLSTRNFAFKQNGNTIINRVRPLIDDLNSLPYFDYNFTEHYILDDSLFKMTRENVKDYLSPYPFNMPTFIILTSRGCPFTCTYCNNNRYINMYGHHRMRFRSVENFVGEIKQVLEKLDFIERVTFWDDDFFLRPTKDIEHFAKIYKRDINLPFFANTSANAYRKEKMEILLDAGLKAMQMGVESGSQRTIDEVYHRNISVSKTLEVTHKIVPFQKSHNMKLNLDFIFDNPYETEDDILETYRYLVDVLPHDVNINLFVLTFTPGTELYNRALKDGLFKPTDDMTTFRIYSDLTIVYQNNYPTFLVMLIYMIYRRKLVHSMPWFLMRFLGSKPMYKFATLFPKNLFACLIKIVDRYIPPFWGEGQEMSGIKVREKHETKTSEWLKPKLENINDNLVLNKRIAVNESSHYRS